MTLALDELLAQLRALRTDVGPDGPRPFALPMLAALDAAIDLAHDHLESPLAPVIARLLGSELIIRTCAHVAQEAAVNSEGDSAYWAGYLATRRALALAPSA